MTPQEELYKATRAKEVIENEVYIEAFEAIKKELHEQWISSPARDAEGREKLWLMQALLNKLKLALESVMAGGEVAKANLRHKQSLLERAKDLLA
jgi:hypothetical protein